MGRRSRRIVSLLLTVFMLAGVLSPGVAPGSGAAAADSEIFRLIRYVLPGRVRVLVVVTRSSVRYTTFTLTGPDRLVVDLLGVAVPPRLAVTPQGGVPVSTRAPLLVESNPILQQLRLGTHSDRVRLVFDLRGPVYTEVTRAGTSALLIDLLTASSQVSTRPTPLQVVTNELLEQGIIVQQAEFGVWPVLTSEGGSTARQAVVTVGYAAGTTERYLLRRDAVAADQWVITQVQTR